MAEYPYSNRDENRFWLEIMGDSALMLHSRIPPGKREAEEALYYYNLFSRLERRAGENLTAEELDQFNRDCYHDVMRFRTYLLDILRSIVGESSFVLLKPVYISHMITLAEEFLYLLGKFIEKKTPSHDPIVQDIFWLPMLYAEARYIADNVGMFQREIRSRAEELETDFNYYFMYAMELQGILRIGGPELQIVKQYRRDLRAKLDKFSRFVQEVITLYQQNALPGTVSLLQLDSISRKLCYYTNQLAAAADMPRPPCDTYGVRLSTV